MPNSGIHYEFRERPDPGSIMPVADGLLWLRMPLPFALSHINLWLLEDRGKWVIVDTGVHTEDARSVWQNVFVETMQGLPASRIVVTHLHPDHVGCAGWLARTFDVELWMSRDEYLLCRVLVADTGRAAPDAGIRFYTRAGLGTADIERYKKMFGSFGKFVAPLPDAYRRLNDTDALAIGDGAWEIITGRGHSPEHASLFNREENIVISGDQLLPTISSNVSVFPTEPAANPLHDWLESLAAMKARLPEDVLVLPAHGKPFRGAHARLDALINEHMRGLDALLELCRQPHRAVDVFPALFKSRITKSNLIMATGESVAHLNYLLENDELVVERDEQGVLWYRRA